MSTTSDTPSQPNTAASIARGCQYASRGVGILSVFIGLAVLCGWLLHIHFLKNLLPGLATMKFNTSFCFILSGASLWMIYEETAGHCVSRRAALICAWAVLVIALLTLAQYAFDWNLGIDQLVVRDPDTPISAWPGRMSIGTGVGFVLIGAGVLLLDVELYRGWWPAQVFALAAMLLGGVATLGYAFGVHTFLLPMLSTMAIHTAALFVVLGLGVLLAGHDRGLMVVVTSPRIGARLARVFLPASVVILALVSWLSLRGVTAGFFGKEFGFALNTLSNIVILAILIWAGARFLNAMQERIEQRNQQNALLASIVATSDDAIVSKDADGRITSWNTGAERIYGYTAAEMLGESMSCLLPPEQMDEERQILTRISLGERIDHINTVRMRKDGRLIYMSITISPVMDAHGDIIGASNVGRDITEQMLAKEALRNRTEELARSNQDLEQFAYVASHDLQEPLRAVAGCTQLLQRRYEGKLDARADELIEQAVSGAKRMQALITDLLTYSRVGKTEDQFHATDCEQAVKQALKNLVTAVRDSGAQVSLGELPSVRAVPGHLTLLFQNLIGNAIKFRCKDRSLRIAVKAEQTGGELLFSVGDNGIGIDPKYFERIFSIFQRLHTRREYPGTGLGLALCKRIVERHSGHIWVESTPGVGTTFFFTLPRGEGTPEEGRDGDDTA